jgi:glycosyltransferase EpsJ
VRAKISVIVPIYNVENYLEKCLNSILNQSFKNLELILVNDGSTDSSENICRKYKKKDDRVKLITKKNEGVSSARNVGLNEATGKYVAFIDPDDSISDMYFKRLFSIAEEKNLDAVICGYKTVPSNINVVPHFNLNKIMNGKDLILSSPNVHSDNDLCFSWRTLYNLELINENNIRFNERLFVGEDVIFNLEYLLASNRVYAISDSLYFYTINNPNSAMRKPYKEYLENNLLLQYDLRKRLSKEYGIYDNECYRRDMAKYYINNIFRLILNNLKNRGRPITKGDFKRILNYEMIKNSIKELGYSYHCGNYREYIYFLALKYKIYSLLIKNTSVG